MARTPSARNALLGSVALTLALYLVPYGHYLAWPLVLVSTLAHELGHGLAALLMGLRFEALVIYPDASGVAYHAGGGGRLARAFVSAGGLVGPSLAAALLFALGRSPRRARYGLGALALVLVVVDVLFVRNLFGLVFVAGLALVAGWLARGSEQRSQLAVVFVAVQLALSVFSRADYLFMAEAQTGSGVMPSDTAQIAEALFLPYWFWGGACGLLSLLVLGLGIRGFFRTR